jgi:hypothetical protein
MGTMDDTFTEATEAGTTASRSRHATPVSHVTELAERAAMLPVGAGLTLRDDLVSTAKGLATKYHARADLERELERFEKRGASARNGVERAVTRNRRHLEREVQQVRKNLDRRSGLVSARVGGITARVEELVSNAQGLMS